MVTFVQRLSRRVIVPVLFVLLVVQPLVAQPSSAIRVLDTRLAEALGEALEGSPTLQQLVSELEQSDVIVHVMAMPASARHPHAGRLEFVTAAGARRFVRITIDARLPYAQRASMLGHELYHAAEVAREATVVTQAAFVALYRRLGHSGGHGMQCLDTVGAQQAGQRVLEEVRAVRRVRSANAHASTGR